MLNMETIPIEARFSKEAIDEQLQKIMLDPLFMDSGILKNFLVFIVDETLKGNSNRLKEYTIAVNVLDKPPTFRPKDSGIVRIHAGRLRRALSRYYCENGILDSIRISIPKGGYVPVFADNDYEPKVDPVGKCTVLAVAPFMDSSQNAYRISLADGLAVQLSNALMRTENFSVIAYYTMRGIQYGGDIKEAAAKIGVHYLVTGNIQMLKGILRIHLQLLHIRSGRLAWSQMYERKFNAEKLFEVQDDIVQHAAGELGELIL